MSKKKLSLFLSLIMVLQVIFMPSVQALPVINVDSQPTVTLEHRSFTNNFDVKASPCLYPWFKLTNTSKNPLNLSDVEIRYYYTKDTTQKQVFNCDWSTIGSKNIKGTFGKVKVPTEKADSYLNMAFGSKSGTLKNGEMIEIHGRLWDSLWANYNQTNDHSFNPRINDYTVWNRVVVLYKGNVIWGLEPLGELETPKLQIYQKDKEAILVWDPIRGAEEYVVKRKSGLGQYEELVTLKDQTTYTDRLEEDKTYSYIVQAKTDNILSKESIPVVYYGKPIVPTLTGDTEGNYFRLKWTNGETPTYNIYKSEKEEGPFEMIARDVTGYTYLDREVNGKEYYYAVTAINPMLESEYSNKIRSKVNSEAIYIFTPKADDDGDGLINDDELYYGTDIHNKDTDGDGFSDKEEVDAGTDPLKITPQTVVEKKVETVAGSFEIKIEADKNFASAPVVVKESDNAVLNAMKGIVGKPIEITAGGFDIYNAQMTFNYDETKLGNISEANLTIFYVNPATKKLEPIETKVDVNNNKVKATTTHFSTYLLGDKNMPVDLTNVDIVFAIDQSGSMGSSDPQHYRIAATQKFVDSMDETHFRLGIVGFEEWAYIKAGMSSDKVILTQALNGLKYYGDYTDIAEGIALGSSLYENNNRAKVMILLSDGQPTEGDARSAAQQVKDKVVINTIALGTGADHQLMRDIASITHGAYFYINNSEGMTYEDVKYQMDTIYTKLIKQLSFDEIINEKPQDKPKVEVRPFDDTLLGVDSIPAREWQLYGNTNILSGNWMTQQVDLESRNIPFMITYNSLSDKISSVGKGFTHSYDSKITYKDEEIVVHYPTGTVIPYGKDNQGVYRSIYSQDIVYKQGNEVILRRPSQQEWVYGIDGTLQRIIEPTGLTLTLSYTGGKVSRVSHNRGDYLEFTYTGNMLTGLKDHTNRTVKYEYEENRLVKATDCKGYTKKYYYNTDGKIEIMVNNEGLLAARNEYDRFGRIIRQYDSMEQVRYTFYHDSMNTRYYINENGYESKVVYNALWKNVLERDAYGNEETNTYAYKDSAGNWIELKDISASSDVYKTYLQTVYNGTAQLRITSSDRMGNITVNYLDSKGNVIQTTNPLGQTSYFSYDKWNNVIKNVNVDGGIANFGRSEDGKRLLSEMDPMGNQKTYEYYTAEEIGVNGLLKRATDAKGNQFTYQYDPKTFEMATLIDPQGSKITYTYDERGNQLTQTLPNGAVTTKTYDEKNNLLKTVSPNGGITSYTYDAYNNKTKEVFADGNAVEYHYNFANQLDKVTYEDGTVEVYTYTRTGVVETFKDRMGQTTTYLYDGQNRKIGEINALGYETKYEYDAKGNLLKTTLPSGAILTYTVDPLDRVTQITDAKGNQTKTVYEVIPNRGTRVITTNALGATTQITSDLLGRKIEEKNDLGYVGSYDYDGNGNLIKKVDPRGAVTGYTYDAFNRVLTVIDPRGGVEQHQYDSVGNRVETTDVNGAVTEFTYDLEGRRIQSQDALGGIAKEQYDVLGRKTAEIDAMGFAVEKVYDKQGRVIKEINQIGNVTTYGYNALGKVVRKTNALDEVTRYEYDELGRLVKEIAPDNTLVQYEYDKVGNRTAEIDQNGNKTTYTYDLMGLQTSIITPDNQKTTYEYDQTGQNTATINPNGHRTQKVYDSLGRLTETINPLGESTSSTYDPVGNVLTETNGEGHTTSYTYDAVSNLETVTLADGTVTRYKYDSMNHLRTQVDSKGNQLAYAYDLLGREVSGEDSLGQKQAVTYDARGSKISTTDRNGQTTTYAYDPCGRVLTETTGKEVLGYTYDKLGRTIVEKRGESTTSYVYNKRGQLVETVYPDGRLAQYEYDHVGNRSTLIDPMGNRIQYEYDVNNRMSKVVYGDVTATYQYDASGNRTGIAFGSGAKINYTFDNANRLVGMTTHLLDEDQINKLATWGMIEESSTTKEQIEAQLPLSEITTPTTTEGMLKVRQKPVVTNTYTYDKRGLQTSKVEDGMPTYYTYDVCGKLLEECTTSGAISYTYDLGGNRQTKRVVTPEGTVTSDYTYDANNRLLKVETSLGEITTYSYDANGNVLQEVGPDGTVAYTYTSRDEVASVQTREGKKVTYAYDNKGIRIRKQVDGTTHDYYYSFGEYIGESVEGDYIAYVYGTGLLGQIQKGNSYTYFTNGHGDVVYVQDQSNTLVNYYGYEAFGNRTEAIETIYNPMTYAGYYYDQETGDYYLRARYYDPENGRFISEDSFRGDYKDPLSLNLYTYGHNSPIYYVDPSGHSAVHILQSIFRKFVGKNPQGKQENKRMIDGEERLNEFEVSKELILANGANLGTAMHELAQVHIGKKLYELGMKDVELEKRLKPTNKEVDIVATDTKNIKYMWEVKPKGRSGEAQLKKYKKLDPSLKRGEVLETIENIYVYNDIKMKIKFPAPGKAQYSFYRDNDPDKEFSVVEVRNQIIVSKRLEMEQAQAVQWKTDPAGALFDWSFGLGNFNYDKFYNEYSDIPVIIPVSPIPAF